MTQMPLYFEKKEKTHISEKETEQIRKDLSPIQPLDMSWTPAQPLARSGQVWTCLDSIPFVKFRAL